MTDQSDTGNPTAGLDTDLTVETLLSRLVTLERIRFSRLFFTDTICPCQALPLSGADNQPGTVEPNRLTN
eukprot:4390899-Pyramimonas_sp.AAC.1